MKFFGVIVFPNPRSKAYESPKGHYEPNSLLKRKIARGIAINQAVTELMKSKKPQELVSFIKP
jgi:hypothetical protein